MWVHWGSEQQEELRYQVTYHTYSIASRGQLSYTPSIEHVVGLTIHGTSLFHSEFFFFAICWLGNIHVRKDTCFSILQAMKAGRDLETRLGQMHVGTYKIVDPKNTLRAFTSCLAGFSSPTQLCWQQNGHVWPLPLSHLDAVRQHGSSLVVARWAP